MVRPMSGSPGLDDSSFFSRPEPHDAQKRSVSATAAPQ
jgi:hypothetical protein